MDLHLKVELRHREQRRGMVEAFRPHRADMGIERCHQIVQPSAPFRQCRLPRQVREALTSFAPRIVVMQGDGCVVRLRVFPGAIIGTNSSVLPVEQLGIIPLAFAVMSREVHRGVVQRVNAVPRRCLVYKST